jgi:CopG family nickel-responsive transcriptional regulator
MHVHLDHHNCLEVVLLKGKAKDIQRLADSLIAVRGVKHGQFVGSISGGIA